MDFYLTDTRNQRIQLPLPPERITANTGARVISFETIALGEIAIPKGKRVARISWDGIFPGEPRRALGIFSAWTEPAALVDILQRWRDSGEKLRLLVTETPLNLDVYIDSFDHSYAGGHGDISYRLELVQARSLAVGPENEVQVQRVAVSAARSRPAPPPPRTYVVKPGDTLWGIAKMLLQNGARWREIYDLNRNVIGPDPNLIRPGQSLRIPGGSTGVA